jgi:hypothetical protein
MNFEQILNLNKFRIWTKNIDFLNKYWILNKFWIWTKNKFEQKNWTWTVNKIWTKFKSEQNSSLKKIKMSTNFEFEQFFNLNNFRIWKKIILLFFEIEQILNSNKKSKPVKTRKTRKNCDLKKTNKNQENWKTDKAKIKMYTTCA